MGFWKKQNHQLQNAPESQRMGRLVSSHVTNNPEGPRDLQARSPTVTAASNRKGRSSSHPAKSGQANVQPNPRSTSADPRNRITEASGNVNSTAQQPSNRAPPVGSPQPKQSRHQQQSRPQQDQRQQQQQRLQQQSQQKHQKQRQQQPPQNPRQEHRQQQQQHGQNRQEQQQQRPQTQDQQQQRHKQQEQQRQQPKNPQRQQERGQRQQQDQAQKQQQEQAHRKQQEQVHRQQHKQQQQQRHQQQQRQPQRLQQNPESGAQAPVASGSSSNAKLQHQQQPKKSSGTQQQQSSPHIKPEQPNGVKKQTRDVSPHAHQQKHAGVHIQRLQPGPASLVATASSHLHQQPAVNQQPVNVTSTAQRQHVAVKKSQGAGTAVQAGKNQSTTSGSSNSKSNFAISQQKTQGQQQKAQGQDHMARSPSQHPKFDGKRVASVSPSRTESSQAQVPPGQFVAVSVSKYGTSQPQGKASASQPSQAQVDQPKQQKQLRPDVNVSHATTSPANAVPNTQNQKNDASSSAQTKTMSNLSKETHHKRPMDGSSTTTAHSSLPVDLKLQKSSLVHAEGSDKMKQSQSLPPDTVGLIQGNKQEILRSVRITPSSSLSGISDNSGAPSKKSHSSDNQSVSGNVVMVSMDADGVRSSGRSTVSVKVDSSKPVSNEKTVSGSDYSGVTSLQVPPIRAKTVDANEEEKNTAADLNHPKTVSVAQSEVISVPVPHFSDFKGIPTLALPKAEMKVQQNSGTARKISAQESVMSSGSSATSPSTNRNASSASIMMSTAAPNTIQTFVTSVPTTALVAQVPDAPPSKTIALISAHAPTSTAATLEVSQPSGSIVVTAAAKTGVTSQPALFVIPKTAAVSLATLHKKVETSSVVASTGHPNSEGSQSGTSTVTESSGSSKAETKTLAASSTPNTQPNNVNLGTEKKVLTEAATAGPSVPVVASTQSDVQPNAISGSVPSAATRASVQTAKPSETVVNASATATALAKTSAQSAIGALVKLNSTALLQNTSKRSTTGSISATPNVPLATSIPNFQSGISTPSTTAVSHTEANGKTRVTQVTSALTETVVTTGASPQSGSVTVAVASSQPSTSARAATSGQQTQAVVSVLPSSNETKQENLLRNDATSQAKEQSQTTSPMAGKFQFQASANPLNTTLGRRQVATSPTLTVSLPAQTTGVDSSSGTGAQPPAEPPKSVPVVSASSLTVSPSTSDQPSGLVREAPPSVQARSQPNERIHSQTLVTSFSGEVSSNDSPAQHETRVNSESSGTGRPQTVAVSQGGSGGQNQPLTTAQAGTSRSSQGVRNTVPSTQPVAQSTATRQDVSTQGHTPQRTQGASQLSGTTSRQTVAVAQSNSPSLNTARHPPRQATSQPSNSRERSASAQPGRNTANSSQQNRALDPSDLQIDVLNSRTRQLDLPEIHTTGLSAGVSSPPRPPRQEALPDILNSHVGPQGPRQNRSRPVRQETTQLRGSVPPGMTQLDDDEKRCCTRAGCMCCITEITRFRWVLVFLAMLGVTCVIIGTVLGALHMTGSTNYLTLSLMFIGLGVVLVIVVGVAWKCTPNGHEPCHMLFSLGSHMVESVSTSPSSRANNRNGRNRSNWSGGVMYPEFRYRRPPPSYSASMQDYQQQLMLAQMQLNQNEQDSGGQDNYSLPSSPPPTYKSRASTIRPGLHITFPPNQSDQPTSRPPTYRSSRNSERPSLPMVPPSQQEDHPSSRVLEYLQGVLQNSQSQVQVSQQSLSQPSQSTQSIQNSQNQDSNFTSQGQSQHQTNRSHLNQGINGNQNAPRGVQSNGNPARGRTSSSGTPRVENTLGGSDGDTDIEAIADTPL